MEAVSEFKDRPLAKERAKPPKTKPSKGGHGARRSRAHPPEPTAVPDIKFAFSPEIPEAAKDHPFVHEMCRTLAIQMAKLWVEPTPETASRVTIELLDRVSVLAHQHVVPVLEASPQAAEARRPLFQVFERLAGILHRNAPDAVRADTIARISALKDAGLLPAFEGGRGSSPQEWVEQEVIPRLDPDMHQHAYAVGVYREPFRRFYNLVAEWRSRGRRGVDKFIVE